MNKKVEKINTKIIDFLKAEFNIPNTTTSNIQLDKYGKELFGEKFSGAYAEDQVPKLSKKIPYCIINNQKSEQEGEHWIALAFIDKDKYVLYDSLGKKFYTIFDDVQNQLGGELNYTDTDPEQTDDEQNCGLRCLASLCLLKLYGIDYLLQL